MTKIVIVIASLSGGGAERVAVNLANYWCRNGYLVTVVTVASDETDAYTLDESITRVTLDMALPSQYVFNGMTRALKKISLLRAIFRRCDADVVVSLMTTVNILAAVACVGMDAKLILAEHNNPQKSSQNRYWFLLRRYIYRMSDCVLALTDTGKQWLEEHTLAKHVVVMPNPLIWPLPVMEPVVSPNEAFPDSQLRLLAVGRLVPQKGFDRLIEALSRIGVRGVKVHLVILGEGPEHARLAQLVKDKGMEHQVSLAGRVGNVGDWYVHADIFVLSSFYEGFPSVLLEAMAAECAVVSVDCATGPSDIIADNVNGLLVEESVEGIQNGLSRLMEDDALRQRLATSAHEVLHTYGEERIMSRWSVLFDDLGVR